jgi:hypothetical protein
MTDLLGVFEYQQQGSSAVIVSSTSPNSAYERFRAVTSIWHCSVCWRRLSEIDMVV